MIDRLLISILIILFALVLYVSLDRVSLIRGGRKPLGLENFKPGLPGILYFTTPDCVPCKVVQRPALEKLKTLLGDQIQIIEINAVIQNDLADHWGVLSVPTLFLIDSFGKPRGVSRGVTPSEKLLKALEEIEGKTFSKINENSKRAIQTIASD